MLPGVLDTGPPAWRAPQVRGVALVALGAIAVALCVGLPGLQARGFPLDDAWIFQVMARNLADTGVWGFLPGRLSSGATSLFWTVVHAANHRFLGMEPVWFAWLMNALALAGASVCLVLLLLDDGRDAWEATSLAAVPLALGNYVWLVSSGMEATWLAFLSVGTVLLWQRDSAWAGAICAAAVLTRPEAIGLPVVLSLAWFRTRGPDRRRGLLLLWGACAVSLVASVAVSMWTAGTLLPTTLEGRKWLYGFDRPSLAHAWAFATTWLAIIGASMSGLPASLLPLILVVLLVGGWRVARSYPGLATLGAWALVVDVMYAIVLPSPGHGGRYQPLNLMLAPVVLSIGVAEVVGTIVRRARGRPPLVVASAAVVALAMSPSLLAWQRITESGVRHINGVHVAMARWVREAVPNGMAVAAFDIGAMAYFSEHPVVDLGGLVDRRYLPYLVEGRVPEYLASDHIRLVVLPAPYRDGVGSDIGRGLGIVGNPALQLRKVAEAWSGPDDWWPAFAATSNASPRLVAYEIRWPR